MISKNILNALSLARKNKQAIVLATGVFDILHQEHVEFLRKAKQEGNFLLVALESDKRVKILKGEGRPTYSQITRMTNLSKLQLADEIMVLPEDFHELSVREKFMDLVRPDILAISSHSLFKKEKSRLVKKHGGKLRIVLEHNPDISTTQIIQKNGGGAVGSSEN